MLPTTVLAVLRRFERLGYRNSHRARRKTGGKARRPIGSPELERKLLTNEVLEAMAPLGIDRRVEYIKQKFNAVCSPDRLRAFYKRNNVTFRVSSTQWRVDEHEIDALEQQRREYAQKLDDIRRNDEPIVYFDETTFHNWIVNKKVWQKKSVQIHITHSQER